MPEVKTQMVSVTGLLPCPFCGSVDLSHISLPDSNETPAMFIGIQCDSCGATGPTTGSKEQHRQLWQLRHQAGGEA